MDFNKIKTEIVTACQRLDQKKLVANHDGNISYKISDDKFLVTPTSFAKIDVKESDLITVNDKGEVIEGQHKVFSEFFWHLAIYRVRPDVQCVIHAHPPTASGIALAKSEIGIPSLPEAIVSLGRSINTTSFISPLESSIKMPGGLLDLEFQRVLSESDACLVPSNGAWTVGQTVMQTYLRMELVEHVAQQHFVAEQLGQSLKLDSKLVDELLKKRPGAKTFSNPKDLRSLILEELENI